VGDWQSPLVPTVRIKVWDVASGRELYTLTGYTGSVNAVAVALTADGRLAVSASEDHTVRLWELTSGASAATFTCDSQVNCCAFWHREVIVAGDAGGCVHFLRIEILQRCADSA
jgi:WD40 repeat protein